ncbi:MAG: hypothetical protein KAY24_15440 [Candidatus Eisenbacteria sp.]|nr:hypothetical protein [Candidatus Eisenbacteria bacterium]
MRITNELTFLQLSVSQSILKAPSLLPFEELIDPDAVGVHQPAIVLALLVAAPHLAKLSIARQIASIILSMWRSEEVYNPAKLKRMT